MNEQKRPRTVTVKTSLSALLVGSSSRREVRIPRRDELPDTVAWIRDADGRDVPAAVAITGRVIATKDIGDARIAQWAVACFPNDARAHARLSKPDLQDLLEDLHRGLTLIGAMPGAQYTSVFSVPIDGGPNLSDRTFDCAGMARRKQIHEDRQSWNPLTVIRSLLGLAPKIHDPWLDERNRAEVDETIRVLGARILGKVWDSWTNDRDLNATLRMLRVPVGDPRQTEFRPGDTHVQILRNVRPDSRKTMFSAEIPKELEDLLRAAAAQP